MILAAIIGFYLADRQAQSSHVRLTADQVLQACGDHALPALLVLRSRHMLRHLVTAIGKALLASLSQTEQKALIALLTLEQEGPNTIKTKKHLVEELNEIRTTGIATCNQEQAWGIRSIATHIPQPGRSRPLAISITTPATQHTTHTLTNTYTTPLTHAAQHI